MGVSLDQSLWTVERVEFTKIRWSEGASGSEIAVELACGITRNGVIGKIHRLGLPLRDKGTNCARKPKQPRKVAAGGSPRLPARSRAQNIMLKVSGNDPGLAEKYAPPISDLDIPPEQRKSILDLTNTTCRWPVGEPGDAGFFFCGADGADLIDHRPYCPHHHRIARQPAPGSTRRQWRGPY